MSSNQPTRRRFIQNSIVAGEAAAAAVFLGQMAASAAQTLAINKHESGVPYKIGILGCGNRSKAHIGALNQVPEIEIAALCDVVEHKMGQRAKLITKKQAAPRQYVDMEKMLAQEDLDAVAIVLPNYLHKMGAVAALAAGKHVFCEKPMALTVPDCNEMIAAAEKANKALQIGTQRRHGPAYIKAVDAIRKAPIGQILSSAVNSYRGDWRVPAPDEYPPGVKYWRLSQEQCGGVVYEMGAHTIDLNNWIFDSEPVTVVSLQGINDHALRPRDSMDHGGVLVRYANDAMMNFGGNLYTHGGVPIDYFFAAKGTLALGEGKLDIKYGKGAGAAAHDEASAPTSIDLGSGDGTHEQWNYFAKVLAGEAEPYPSGHAGRQSIQICQGSVISAREGKLVNVKDLD